MFGILHFSEGKGSKNTFFTIQIPTVENTIRLDCSVSGYIPGHSVGSTHWFLSSSITVPSGHWHPFRLHTRGQTMDVFWFSQVRWHDLSEAQPILTCPNIGQAKWINKQKIKTDLCMN